MLRKLRNMLFWHSVDERPRPDPIAASVRIAVQGNERASERAREALEDLRTTNGMRETLQGITGKM